MTYKYRVDLTRPQLEALREAATFRLSGEWDGSFDGNVLDRADTVLMEAIGDASESGQPPESSDG